MTQVTLKGGEDVVKRKRVSSVVYSVAVWPFVGGEKRCRKRKGNLEMARGRGRGAEYALRRERQQSSKIAKARKRDAENMSIPFSAPSLGSFPFCSQAIEFPTSAPSNQQNKPAQLEWGSAPLVFHLGDGRRPTQGEQGLFPVLLFIYF